MPDFPYTEAQTFQMDNPRLMTVLLGPGGTVTIEALHQVNPAVWVLADTITENGVYTINEGVPRVRISPFGGSTYNIW